MDMTVNSMSVPITRYITQDPVKKLNSDKPDEDDEPVVGLESDTWENDPRRVYSTRTARKGSAHEMPISN